MGIPATLSSVPATTPYIQYVATSGQTVFPYPFVITQDSDLVVVDNGTTYDTDAGYAVSGAGNPTGGNVTLTTGATAGDIITLYRDIPIERLTQFAQNGGFSSTAFNAEFNNVYLLLQQLQTSIDQCLQIPNTNNPAPTTSLTSGAYANKYLAFDANGNPTPALLTSSGSLTQALLAGLLTPQTLLEAAQNVVPVYEWYQPGDARRYGCDPTGVNDSASGFADWSLILGSYKGLLIGTFKSSATVAIPSGALVEWEASSVIKYTGSGAALALSSVKDVTLRRPTIDLSGAGSAAIGIQLSGAWLVDIEHPKITFDVSANTQQGIQINTSAVGGQDFGAYLIRITNPNIGAVDGGGQFQYGILAQQTAGDSVQVTHLQIESGWINNGTTAAIKLTNVSTFRVEGTTLEHAADGLQYEGCNNGFISLGEVDCTGYAVNPLDAISSHVGIVYPSLAGNPVSGYVNTTNSTPDLIGYSGEMRLYPSGLSSSGYGVSYKAQFNAAAVLVETVYAAGQSFTLRNVNGNLAGGLQQFTKVASISATGTAGTNLCGTATFVASTTVNVAFANTEPDANYRVLLTPVGNPGGSLWVSVGQTTAGFEIVCSASTSVSVNWLIVR